MGMPLSPALLKAAKEPQKVPQHLLSLIPESQKQEILVDPGHTQTATYQEQLFTFPMVLPIYPLIYSVCADLSSSFQKILTKNSNTAYNCVHSGTVCTRQQMVCAEKGITAFAAPSPCQAVDCDFFTRSAEDNLFTAFIESELPEMLISFAVCGNGEFSDFFRNYMTIQQKMDALSKIYEMNMSLNVFGNVTSRKNAESLLKLTPLQRAEIPEDQESPKNNSE